MILFNLYHGGRGILYDTVYRKVFRIRVGPARLSDVANESWPRGAA